MRTVLKGSPKWTIGNDGKLSVSTTWMCLRDITGEDTALHWLEFQNKVEAFAGKAGDKYKQPIVSDTKDREVTEFTEVDTFIVTDVTYEAVVARSHYEVTFTNAQNDSTVTVGDVSLSINENNERTATASYNVRLTEGVTVNDIGITSGTTVDWFGVPYYVRSAEYTPVATGFYQVQLTAVDMSYMMIGLPQETKNGTEARTLKSTWRFSAEAYEAARGTDDMPTVGMDAKAFMGNAVTEEGTYIITSVDVQSDGVLGYKVSITAADHTTYKRLKSSMNLTRSSTGDIEVKWESDFKADSPDISSLPTNGNYTDIENLLPEGVDFDGLITGMSFTEYVPGKYDVHVSMEDNTSDKTVDVSSNDAWSVSVSQGAFVLTDEQCGWAKGPSGGYYMINFPPATTFRYSMTPDTLIDQATATGGVSPNVTAAYLLQKLKQVRPNGNLYGESIVGVKAFVNGVNLRWLSPAERASLKSLDAVQEIMLEGYVHAQPPMTTQGSNMRGSLFTPWTADEYCPLRFYTTHPQYQGRDKALNKCYIQYEWQYHDISVSMPMVIDIKQALRKNIREYYTKAIAKVRCINYTSYKGMGIDYSYATTSGSDGSSIGVTTVNCKIRALLTSNPGKPIWNDKFDNCVVFV